jgi:hypothetical protein
MDMGVDRAASPYRSILYAYGMYVPQLAVFDSEQMRIRHAAAEFAEDVDASHVHVNDIVAVGNFQTLRNADITFAGRTTRIVGVAGIH